MQPPPLPPPPPRKHGSPGIAPKIASMKDHVAKKTASTAKKAASTGGTPVQGRRQKRDEQELMEAAEEAVSSSEEDEEVDEDDIPGAVRVSGRSSINNDSSELSRVKSTETEERQPTAILVSEHIIDEEEQTKIVKEAQRKAEESLKATAVQAQAQDIEEENRRKALRKKRIIGAVVLVAFIAVGVGIGAYFGSREPDADPTPAPTPSPPTSAPTPDPDLDLSNNVCEGAFSVANVLTVMLGANTNSSIDRVDTCEIIFENGVGSWYRMQGDDQRMIASTCQGTFFDSQVSIFTGVCGRLLCVAGNDQMACGNGDQSQVAWFAEADTAYFIFVHGRRRAEGLFTLAIGPSVKNDECENALSVEPFSVPFFGSTRGASVDDIACGTARSISAPGVWYTFEGIDETEISASVLIRDEGELRITTAFRGQISVFEGSDCGNLECVAGSIDGQVTLEPTEGKTYFVFVNGRGGVEGDFILAIGGPRLDTGAVPSLCIDALELLPDTSASESTRNVALSTQVGSCGDMVFSTAPGVWFHTVGTGGVFQASTCATISGFDTQISVFVGVCHSLVCLDGNDQDGECGDGSTVSWFTTIDEDYFILVHGHSGRVGSFNLSLANITIEVSDTCGESIRLSSNGSTRLGSTDGANFGDLSFMCEGLGTGPGVWYELDGTGVNMTASTCQVDSDASNITIYTGECDALECVDKVTTPCGLQSSVTWNTELGVTYFLFVQDASQEVRFLQSDFLARRAPKGSFVLTVEETPINDLCSNAIGPLLVDGSTKFASTRGATSVDAGTLFCSDERQLGRGVWFTLIGDGRLLTASTCSEQTRFEAQITVFQGDRGSCFDLECVEDEYVREFDESLTCGRLSTIEFSTVAGQQYFILISGDGFEEFGNFGLAIGAENDICQGAIGPLLADNSIILGSTIGASVDDVVSCGNLIISPGVWYQVYGQGSRMTASTCNSKTEYETEIFIYRGSCGRLECVEEVEYASCGLQSQVSWTPFEEGELNYILVHGYGAGMFGLSITMENQGCSGARLVLEESPFTKEFGSTSTNAPIASAIACGVQQETPGNWFVLKGTGGTVTASTCEAAFVTIVSVFRGACNNLECVVTSNANSKKCDEIDFLKFDTAFGELLYILVQGADLQQSGRFDLQLERAEPTTCENAFGPLVISRGGGIHLDGSLPLTVDSAENGIKCGQAIFFGDDGFYYSVAGTGTTINATTCFDATDFDTQLTIYSGSCDDLQCITGNDDIGIETSAEGGSKGRKRLNRKLEDLGCSSLASSVSWESEIGVDYFVYVHAFASSFGNFTLSIEAMIHVL